MSEFNIPNRIRSLSEKSGKTILVSEPMRNANHEHLFFVDIELTDSDNTDSIFISLVHNDDTMDANEYVPDSIRYRNCVFSDESDQDMWDILESLVDGKIIEKKSLFGKKKVCVIDKDGSIKYWPRISY